MCLAFEAVDEGLTSSWEGDISLASQKFFSHNGNWVAC
jgi:hypothetical protein